MAKFLYQGHASFRITANDGRVLYVDPFAGEGYDIPADIVLVTHQHGDHDKLELITQKHGCRVITNVEALEGGSHNTFELDGITIEAVEAGNRLHNPKKCVGYVITVDGVKLYTSGDTSKTAHMGKLASAGLDYALLCCDGIFNMGLKESAICARLIGARHSIPIHMKPGQLFDRKRAEKWDVPDKLILEPGQEITLAST